MRLLIANRGEIACRIARSARRLGIATVAVYSDADRDALHTTLCDVAVHIGPSEASKSYLSIERIIEAARVTGADTVHPGYGFLSENADFARACAKAGLTFVGPPPEAIAAMGGKRDAKELVAKHGVPSLPWATAKTDDELLEKAPSVGFPLMIKASAGGGGRGLRRVNDLTALSAELPRARSEAQRAFGDDAIILERALDGARHVEIQILADSHGTIVHLGERDCSLQRRHQKVIEEAPAVSAELRQTMGEAAIAAARSVGYVGAGTIEFLLAPDGQFYFLEMNTRLQVEHPVTEAVTGFDIVGLQLAIARGEALPFDQEDVRFSGHAIEARLYAEDDAFVPQTGEVLVWRPSTGARVDHGLREGYHVGADYDAMLAKIIVHAEDRPRAIERLVKALETTVLHGVTTNREFLLRALRTPEVREGRATTRSIDDGIVPAPGGSSLQIRALVAALFAGRPNIGFRLLGHAIDRLRFEIDGVIVLATVEADTVTIDDQKLRVAVERSLASVGDVTAPLIVTRTPDTLFVTWGAESATAKILPLTVPKRARTTAGAGVTAPMSGRIISVLVEDGATVEAGTVLLVLEAMKMQLEVKAPRSAVVTSVRVREGEQVAARAVLVDLASQDHI